MKLLRCGAAALALILAAQVSEAEIISGEGASMQFSIYGVKINDGSTLKRTWTIVNDEELPISISNYNGLETRYADSRWSFRAAYRVEVSQPITAYEIRFLPFSIWGEQGRTLSSTEVRDFSVGERNGSGEWNILSESDAVYHIGSVAFISQVRMADGTILKANLDEVLEAARSYSADLAVGDLEGGPPE